MNLQEFNDSAQRQGLPGRFRRVVFTIHGFNTRATWQRTVSPELQLRGFLHVPIDLGYFFFSIFWPCTGWRLRQAEKRVVAALEKYDDEVSRFGSGAICHSFGTLATVFTLRRNSSLRVNRLILVCSLLPVDYDWSPLLNQNAVEGVLAETTPTDVWVKLAPLAVAGAGPSGVHGFTCDDPRIQVSSHLDSAHARLLSVTHCKRHWLPYLS